MGICSIKGPRLVGSTGVQVLADGSEWRIADPKVSKEGFLATSQKKTAAMPGEGKAAGIDFYVCGKAGYCRGKNLKLKLRRKSGTFDRCQGRSTGNQREWTVEAALRFMAGRSATVGIGIG